jgi:hypothetical protein
LLAFIIQYVIVFQLGVTAEEFEQQKLNAIEETNEKLRLEITQLQKNQGSADKSNVSGK